MVSVRMDIVFTFSEQLSAVGYQPLALDRIAKTDVVQAFRLRESFGGPP